MDCLMVLRKKGHYFKPNAGWEGDENRLLANFNTAYRRKPLYNNFPSQKREEIRVLHKGINIKITNRQKKKKNWLVCVGWAVAQTYHRKLSWKSTVGNETQQELSMWLTLSFSHRVPAAASEISLKSPTGLSIATDSEDLVSDSFSLIFQLLFLHLHKSSQNCTWCKSKPQWGTITRQSGWLLSKSLQAINAGDGVEKREPSYTVGGNAN